ncbi:sugar/nucleoside kinase (ribokinase family) [Bradyrhizobium sp. GM5.1]
MQALFIGQTYIDVVFITDHMPTGDEKHVASDYAVSFGGNAVTAAFCCAKLGIVPDLIATAANDWLGRMFMDMCAKYAISLHGRKVNQSSLSFIMPKDGKRAIVRCRDDDHIHPFPMLNLGGCRALHVDGHQPDAAIHYAKVCREAGILTSLDGGGLRTNTHELLEFIDVAIVAERLCEQMDLTPEKMLDYLKSRGCKIGGITMGEKGLLWYDETGNGAGDAGDADSARARDRHQRRRRRLPWRLCLFLSRPSRQKLARAFRFCPGSLDLQDPASWQRSWPADSCRHRQGQARVRG